jgi:hypothetical protein
MKVDQPDSSVGFDGSPAGIRTFSLKDPEAYEILCGRDDRPWIPNGALPREPRMWEQPVIPGVE